MALPDDFMMANPTPGPTGPLRDQWHARHNMAVTNWRRSRIGATNNATAAERSILDLAAAIDGYVTGLPEHADPLSGQAVWSLMEGFRGLLNYDTGRLDGGTLASWAAAALTRWGVDPDTGAWVGGA